MVIRTYYNNSSKFTSRRDMNKEKTEYTIGSIPGATRFSET
jgi:hypothetical protein